MFNYRNTEYLLRCFKSLGSITHSYKPVGESSVSIAANSIPVGVALRQAFPFVTDSSHNFYVGVGGARLLFFRLRIFSLLLWMLLASSGNDLHTELVCRTV